MIKTATQLKAKIRNLSGGDNDRARVLIRNFVMERFLERVALSKYRNNFILKGGMLVAAVVGLETRATMDIDTTVKSLPLTMENARKVVEDIIQIDVPDGMSFAITKVSDIMEGHDYPGIRFMLEASLEKLRQTIKIDISTGDVITPQAVEYSYKLMFDDRSISIWTYNLETLLGEKLETIMARETANTRMRDFYDIYILTEQETIDYEVLHDAFMATSIKRETTQMIPRFDSILDAVKADSVMREMWEKYRQDNYFVGDLSWEKVNDSVRLLKEKSQIQD
ncbi:MAG: nucleotidyl transferase AbiEii/AbiGii toxin family protein [Clostridia bacterium]|nr:nucleotidyl transferase AbiEii/AbiGii toxin family protein [Clostridia bacterium]MBQ8964176.1 nucleotidyl transferase AbiEii/AbiGii toxin family protein [Clostridia bacterium]